MKPYLYKSITWLEQKNTISIMRLKSKKKNLTKILFLWNNLKLAACKNKHKIYYKIIHLSNRNLSLFNITLSQRPFLNHHNLWIMSVLEVIFNSLLKVLFLNFLLYKAICLDKPHYFQNHRICRHKAFFLKINPQSQFLEQ